MLKILLPCRQNQYFQGLGIIQVNQNRIFDLKKTCWIPTMFGHAFGKALGLQILLKWDLGPSKMLPGYLQNRIVSPPNSGKTAPGLQFWFLIDLFPSKLGTKQSWASNFDFWQIWAWFFIDFDLLGWIFKLSHEFGEQNRQLFAIFRGQEQILRFAENIAPVLAKLILSRIRLHTS